MDIYVEPYLEIAFQFPPTTIEEELANKHDSMDYYTILINIGGDVLFKNKKGITLLGFEDIAIFFLASDFFSSINKITAGDDMSSFCDFYGEFELTIKVINSNTFRIEDIWNGKHFYVDRNSFLNASLIWSKQLKEAAKNTFPVLSKNPDFERLFSYIRLGD